MPTPSLAIVWHSRTGAAEAMAEAALAGAEGVGRRLAADEVTPEALSAAQGYIFVCPENLGGLSGAMKEMFDRCFYPLLGRVEGRPYATAIAAGSAGQGAEAQIDRIVTGWRLRRVAEPLIVNLGAQTPEAILAPKRVPAGDLDRCRELGAALAEGLRRAFSDRAPGIASELARSRRRGARRQWPIRAMETNGTNRGSAFSRGSGAI